MNTFVRSSLLICLLGLTAVPSVAQITITQADVSRILAPPNQVFTRTDSTTTSLNIGTAGLTSNRWNFSGIRTSYFQVLRSVAASGTPHIGNFSGATNAFRLDTTLQGISGSIYQYLQASPTELRNMGGMARATPFPGVTVELRISVTPNEVVYKLPATLGTVWTTGFTNRTLITLNGSVLSDVSNTHNASYRIDAAGTMLLPGNAQAAYALRIRKVNFYNNNPVGGYIFLSKGGALVQVETNDTTRTSGTIAITRNKTTWNYAIVSDSTTDVRVGASTPSQFALRQNYPNPFNPSTRIEYSVAKEEFVSLKVYNLIGQEVASLVNENKPAGTYIADWNAEGLPSGMYFYKMQTRPTDGGQGGSFSATRRMMLVK